MRTLGERNITSILCEGGGKIATALLRERLADKIIFAVAPKLLGRGIEALGDIGISGIENAIELGDVEIERIENDVIITGYPM